MYGPTVVITTFVDWAIRLSDSGSPTSAWRVEMSVRPIRSSVCRSLSWLRPATAQLVFAGALLARYSAVRAPVKPVAPNTTMSYSRSGIGAFGDRLRGCDRGLQVGAGLGRHPARSRRRDPLGGVGGLGGEVEDRLELVGGWRGRAELFGEGGEPIVGVHRRCGDSIALAPAWPMPPGGTTASV